MINKVITLKLKARTAVHIGSGAGDNTADALIRRDAQGRPIIPGTAIAGALRTLLTRLAPRLTGTVCAALTKSNKSCKCVVCQLMGDINPSDEEGSTSNASRLLVGNANLDDGKAQTSIRDGVGIDRATGAAARAGHVKFDLEALPSGVAFTARMELRDPTRDDERLLAAGLAEWKAGRAWLGGRVARGLGAFSVEVQAAGISLDTAAGLVAYLKADRPWETTQPDDEWLSGQIDAIEEKEIISVDDIPKDIAPYVAQRWVRIRGTLQAEGPLLINDAAHAGLIGFDHAPLLVQMGDWKNPVLTGAGLRGVIRSHSERIARTLTTYSAVGEADFLAACPACNPVESRADAPLASCDSLLPPDSELPGEEADVQLLCLGCRLFGSTRRGSRLLVEDAPYDLEAAGGAPTFKMFDFLAIDRFTGGGADRFKFDALTLWRPAFTLSLYFENPERWELGWLALVLRDMQAGWLSVGMGAAKGFGRVKLENLTITFGYLDTDDAAALDLDSGGQRNGSLYHEMLLDLAQAGPWVEAFHTKLEQFTRGEPKDKKKLPRMAADTYFREVNNLAIHRLYPTEVAL